MLHVLPTTLAGAAALLAYAAEHARRGCGWPEDLVDGAETDQSERRHDWEVYLHEAVADALVEIDRLQPVG